MKQTKNQTGKKEKNDELCRREFVKLSAITAGTLFGTQCLPGLEKTANAYDWKPVSYPRTVLHNFRLFDNTHGQLRDDQLLIIEGERIKGIESLGSLDTLKGYQKIDMGGRTLLPGFIDNHVHITVPFMYDVNLSVFSQMNDQIELNFRNCIMNGVTTVRDVGGFPGKINKFRDKADRNEIPGPRVISSLSPIAARQEDMLGAPEKAPYFTNPVIKWFLGGNYAERPTNVQEINNACDEMIEKGAQWLKTLHQDQSYSYFARKLPNHTDEGYLAILKKGEQKGLKCALHEPFVSGFQKGITLGFQTLEHMPHDDIIPDADIETFIKKEMAILPTILVYWDVAIEEKLLSMIKSHGESLLMPEAIQQMTAKLKSSIDLQSKTLSESERRKLQFDPWYMMDKLPNMKANLQKLHKMGATIGIGTDLGGAYAAFFGRYTDELKHFAAAGISNFDILCKATSINAKIIDRQNDIGTLQKGKLADIIAVQGNPLLDLAVLDTIDMVMKGGHFIKAEGINHG
ncbi:amidohydrolase family protein [bacterium]|nr:amidohydrolase family protein [bacterium]